MLAACTSAQARPDAPPPAPPIEFKFRVGSDHTRPSLPLTILIDGSPTTEIDQTYDPSAAGTLVQHTLELRYQDITVATLHTGDVLSPCYVDQGAVTSYLTGADELDSGDFRYVGAEIDTTNGVCSEDAFGWPNCNCPADQRCVPRVSYDGPPRFTHLGCAPIGAKQHGDACTFTPDPAGAYDDCGASMFCYQGACHTMCVIDHGNPNPLPPPSDEYPPEVSLCD